jgi:adenine-specific DNA-methyltransferase
MKDNRKNTGSFYTPKLIADFLVNYLFNKLEGKSNITILEPSAGDGSFINAIYYHNKFSPKILSLTAVEREKDELNKITSVIKHKTLNTVNSDFLEFQDQNHAKFSLVIGNPPYIKNNLLNLKIFGLLS